MGQISERLPILLRGSTLLMGAMLLGAATASRYTSTTLHAQEPACDGLAGDAEDSDDCGEACVCNDAMAICVGS